MDEALVDEGWVSAGQAAVELQTTMLRVLMLVKSGQLVGRECAGGWQVSRESLLAQKKTGPGRTASSAACGGCTGCGQGA